MLRSKKAQSSIFLLISLIVIGLVWITGLSVWIAETGSSMVVENSLTGFNAFFYSNLNLFIGIAWLLSLIFVARAGFG